MASSIKIRAKSKKGVINVKCLIKHPMETGRRKDKETGKKVPEHFIREMKAEKNGVEIIAADWNSTISANPYLNFKCEGEKGDKIKISWTDSKGKTDSLEKASK